MQQESEKWAEKKKKREKMHMAYNKLAVKVRASKTAVAMDLLSPRIWI